VGCDSPLRWGGNTNGTLPANGSAFLPTGAMNEPRATQTATLLSDGTVLIVDGGQLDIDDLLVSIPSAEIFDPSQGKFSSTGQPCIARELHTATLLSNRKVLIAGGNEFNGYPTWLPATSTAELYDPSARSFANTGSMQAGRSQHTATLLADGRVLVAGGSNPDPMASAELYDPTTEKFTAGGNLANARFGHTATLLPSGKVLIAGGQSNTTALASAELYDPTTNTFSATGTMTSPRSGHTATLLPDGKVLIAGGASSLAFGIAQMIIGAIPLQSAEVYDPATGIFSPVGTMVTGRLAHTATLLPNGKVLIAGGFKEYSGGYISYSSTEIYDPVAASFSSGSPMNATRFWHSATALADGSVLVAGGIGGDSPQVSAEIYK